MIYDTHKARLFGLWLERTCGHYWYLIGTRGQRSSSALIQRAWDHFPGYRAAIEACANKSLHGNPDKGVSDEEGEEWKVTDCEGWEECFRMGGDIGNPLSDDELINPDVRTGEIYALAISEGLKHGLLATLPKDCPYPIAVGHVGHVTYFHKGFIWQAQGHCYGTTKSLLTDSINADLVYWYQMPYYDYEDYLPFAHAGGGGGGSEMIICQKSTLYDDNAKAVQYGLAKLGYELGDVGLYGQYGNKTAAAVAKFQSDNKLPVNGDIFDDKCNQKMLIKLATTGITQAQLDAEKAKTVAAQANVTRLNTIVTNLNASIVKKNKGFADIQVIVNNNK
jgi:hypothetical protein